MSLLWPYFWPILLAGLVIGIVAGWAGFRRKDRRRVAIAIGVGACLASAWAWHGPLGAARQLTDSVERNARVTLEFYEVTQVTARLHRQPLSRRLILRGPADDFQRRELMRTMTTLPAVGSARWYPAGAGVPLIVEAAGAGILGFLFGMLLAYLAELHRRHNAQWNW